MRPDALQKHIIGTYFTLRLGIVVASLLLPLVLYFGGNLGPHPGLLPSLSDYYVKGSDFTRDWFVGTLCTIGVSLYLYKGYSNAENVVLNIAGVLAVVVALVRCRCGDVNRLGGGVHGTAAVLFFVCMAIVCLFCASDTLPLIPQEEQATERHFKMAYRVIGIVMILFPAIALVITLIFDQHDNFRFFVEAAGIYTFAAYWLVKSIELSKTEAEAIALRGQAMRVKGRGVVRAEEGARGRS